MRLHLASRARRFGWISDGFAKQGYIVVYHLILHMSSKSPVKLVIHYVPLFVEVEFKYLLCIDPTVRKQFAHPSLRRQSR